MLRIARHDVARDRMRLERRVLHLLAGRLSLPSPRVVAVADEETHDLCIKAPGKPLDWREWGALSLAEKRRMCVPFDFADCAVRDPHRDLRYDPGLEIGGDELVRAYERSRGLTVSRARQRGLHALSALSALSWSLDHEDGALQGARWGWVDRVAEWDLRCLDEFC